MNKITAIILMIFAALLAALSQVILKKSSENNLEDPLWKKMLQPGIFIAYSILLVTMFLNVLAYRFVPYKLGPILNALSYVFVILFGRLFFQERFSRKKWVGVVFIVTGVLIYNL